MGIQSSGQRRLLATNTTNAAAVLAAGRYESGYLLNANAGYEQMIVPMGGVCGIGSLDNRRRGVEATFFGVGANNSTAAYKAWRYKEGYYRRDSRYPADFELDLICSGVITLGTGVVNPRSGALGPEPAIGASNAIADTVTVVVAALGTYITAAYGGAAQQAYSPADNTQAKLIIPDVGGGDLLLEIWKDTCTSINALVEQFE